MGSAQPSPPAPLVHADVVVARERIGADLRHTPILPTTMATAGGPVDVVFKLEFTQFGGCFKPRGSLNAIRHANEEGRLGGAGVVVASGGNAAIGAAWAAGLSATPCTVVVPETVPAVKLDALRHLGAVVETVGDRYQQAADAAVDLADRTGALLLHAYDQPDIVAGAGTIGLELVEQVDGPLTTVVCVGGGGLLAGLSATLRSGDHLVGAEPSGASCLHQARAAGRRLPVDVDSVAADALGATQVGEICWTTATSADVESVVVSDPDIVDARRYLWEQHRLLVEHGTATAVAAVRAGAASATPGTTLCVVLCGANTPLEL